jgi:HSP20 family protein
MSDIIRRNQNQSLALDPWRDFFDLNNFWSSRWPGFSEKSLPAVNIAENENEYGLEVVAPGFDKEDFRIDVDEDILTISAETKQTDSENRKDYRRREYSSNSFTRSFRLPDNSKDDSISASYKDGILHITIPKSEKEMKATKKIDVK